MVQIDLDKKDKIALVGFNKDINFIKQDLEYCHQNQLLTIYSSWLIQEEFEDLYKKNKPFNLYINTGHKKLEYVYTIVDFVSKKGAEGICCPKEWLNFINSDSQYYSILKNNNFTKFPQMTSLPIKTWMLVNQIKEVKTNIGWETLKDIRGIPARNPGKSYYLYVVDPLEKGEDND